MSLRLLAYAIAAAAIASGIWAAYNAVWARGYEARRTEQIDADLQALREATAALNAERERQNQLARDQAALEASMRAATAGLQREARAHAEASADLAKLRLTPQLVDDWNAGAKPP